MAKPREHVHVQFLTKMIVLVGNLDFQSITNHYQTPCVYYLLADYNFNLYGDQPEFFMYKFPERATTYKVNSGGWALYSEPKFQGKVMYHFGSRFCFQ